MNGMELSRRYFNEVGYPALKSEIPEILPYLTVGLVGQGSECFGFDDEISQDHDWGPSFAMWLPQELYKEYSGRLNDVYRKLRKDFAGYPPRINTAEAQGRDGILETEDFYFRFLGVRGVPQILTEWFRAPEHAYACVSNGILFWETDSEFEKIRKKILEYYPEDVRKKKIAARAVMMAQTGQYNFPRCLKRGETVAAFVSLSEFIQATCSMIHLLNKKYVPFYKWAHRSVMCMDRLSDLGIELGLLTDFSRKDQFEDRIEYICSRVLQEMKLQQLTDSDNTFLAAHGIEIMKRIEDEQIRSLPVLFG